MTLSSKRIRGGKITVKVPVTNVGQVAGSEVVQVYVHDCEASVEMPEKQLKSKMCVDMAVLELIWNSEAEK